jgi:hypothetical protein
MDRLLDQAQRGGDFSQANCRCRLVHTSIEYGVQLGHHQAQVRVIMPNRVRLLVTPQVSASKFLGSLTAATGRRANILLKRTGHPFWRDEIYDRLVRSDEEFQRIRWYIENNPVTACLVAKAGEYAWSSGGRPERPPQPKGLPHLGDPGMYGLQGQAFMPELFALLPTARPPAGRYRVASANSAHSGLDPDSGRCR